MKLGQVWWQGRLTAAVFEAGQARPIPGYTVRELVERAERDHVTLTELAARYAMRGDEYHEPAIPIEPREVWACGCTYEMSASFRDAEHGSREGYRHVFVSPRPEIFFKGNACVCRPQRQNRHPARLTFTAPRARPPCCFGAKGRVSATRSPPTSRLGHRARESALPTSDLHRLLRRSVRHARRFHRSLHPAVASTSAANRCCSRARPRPLGCKIEQLVEFLLRQPCARRQRSLTGTGIASRKRPAPATW